MASLLGLVNGRNIGIVFRNIRKAGLVTTVRYITSDLLFDMKYGVETINTQMLDELEIDSPNKEHGRYYEGTNAYVFGDMIRRVKVDPATCCFIDFGSGKGKAMMLAAERRFERVIGVEFSRELVEACEKNLEIFRAKTRTATQFEVVHMDAALYAIPPEANLLYFANPFDEVLIGKVIDNILASYEACPRTITIMHLYPQGNRAFVDHPRLRLDSESQYGYVLHVEKQANGGKG